MPKWTEVYKVVRVSYATGAKRLLSYSRHLSEFEQEYRAGEIAEPQIGFLYAFSDQESAKRWMNTAHFPCEIWSAQAEIYECDRPAMWIGGISILRWWATWENRKDNLWAPRGTVWCKKIKLDHRIL